MPLKSSISQHKAPVHAIQDQRRREQAQHALLSRANTPLRASDETRSRSDSNASNESELINGLGHREEHGVALGNRQSALALKMDLPKGLELRLGTTTDGENATGYKTYEVQNQSYGKNAAKFSRKTQSAFDDTESFDIDSDGLYDEIENTTMVFRGDHSRGIQAGSDQREDTHNGINSVHNRENPQTMSIELNTQDMAAIEQEKMLYLQNHGQMYDRAGSTFPALEFPQDQRSSELAMLSDNQLNDETPSRNRITPIKSSTHNIGAHKTVSFDSPGTLSRDLARAESPGSENVPSPSDRHSKLVAPNLTHNDGKKSAGYAAQAQARRMKGNASLSLKSDDQRHARGWTHSMIQPGSIFDPSRESDYPTSDDDDDGLSRDQRQSYTDQALRNEQKQSQKRPHEADLDHSLTELRTMTYKQLDQEAFIDNPHKEANGFGRATQGSVTTLSQKLEQLSKMSEEEQKRLFLSQDDEEWTQTGSWFIDRLQDQLKSLTEIRTERRKISMRFEDEIRRRQKDVEWATGGIEEELKGLKRGGGELIRGRSPHSGQQTIRKN